ncbi:hypothetical protein M1446_01875 [Candidatus Dependentiae bacterium]|nr:hypothetical protein [Candidatus Dependentiae bacterium]
MEIPEREMEFKRVPTERRPQFKFDDAEHMIKREGQELQKRIMISTEKIFSYKNLITQKISKDYQSDWLNNVVREIDKSTAKYLSSEFNVYSQELKTISIHIFETLNNIYRDNVVPAILMQYYKIRAMFPIFSTLNLDNVDEFFQNRKPRDLKLTQSDFDKLKKQLKEGISPDEIQYADAFSILFLTLKIKLSTLNNDKRRVLAIIEDLDKKLNNVTKIEIPLNRYYLSESFKPLFRSSEIFIRNLSTLAKYISATFQRIEKSYKDLEAIQGKIG